MLESVEIILNHFINDVNRFSVHSVDIERGSNPEEIYYLVQTGAKTYIVIESDYVGSLNDIASHAIDAYSYLNLSDINWIKHDVSDALVESATYKYGNNEISEEVRASLLLKINGSYLQYLVLEIKTGEIKDVFSPTSYGNRIA